MADGRQNRQQPWSTYAVHQTTLTAWAIPTDFLLVYLACRATEDWGHSARVWLLACLGVWMFTSKWIKLIGHFIRYPVDIVFLPVSIIFGYIHGFLKLYAMVTLDVVSLPFSDLRFAANHRTCRRHGAAARTRTRTTRSA